MVIPKIIKLPSGSYFCQLRINGQSVMVNLLSIHAPIGARHVISQTAEK